MTFKYASVAFMSAMLLVAPSSLTSAGPLLTGVGIDVVGAPQACGSDDGCSGAPYVSPSQLDAQIAGAYMVQHRDFFTGYAAQSRGAGSSHQPLDGVYPIRPPWHVAGVDYPVGIPASSFPLKVPGVNPLPANCTAYTTAPGTSTNYVLCFDWGAVFKGTVSLNQLTVTSIGSGSIAVGKVISDADGTSATITALNSTTGIYTLSTNTLKGTNFTSGGVTFDGWDFSQNGGVFLKFGTPTNGPVVIKNSKFVYGSTFAGTGAYGSAGSLISLLNAGSLLFMNNYVDANAPQANLDVSSMAITITAGHYPITLLYNALLRGRIRNFTSTGYGVAQGDLIVKFNYIEGLIYSKTDISHGEVSLLTWTGVMENQIWKYNTWLQPNTTFMDLTTSGLIGMTGTIVPSNSTPVGAILTNFVVDHETHVQNYAFVDGAYVIKATTGAVGVEMQNAAFGNVTLTNNYLDNTASYYCFETPNSSPMTNFTTGGNVNLNSGHPANGLAVPLVTSTATLSNGVLTILSINYGGVGVGSEISIGTYKVHILSQGTGRGTLGTYYVDNKTASVPNPNGIGIFSDQCDYAP